ncbi:MAG: hypothetical protein KJ574_01800, partial [Nanoarchaeota archaeon]|nr:hypothetical protein [Nanoarchaeota archaeon]
APVLSKIADVTVYEGETVKLEPTATDAENDKLTYKYSGWMTSSSKKTGYDDAGEYDVTVTASDGEETDSQKVKVTVLNKNRHPRITAVYMEEPTEAVKKY